MDRGGLFIHGQVRQVVVQRVHEIIRVLWQLLNRPQRQPRAARVSHSNARELGLYLQLALSQSSFPPLAPSRACVHSTGSAQVVVACRCYYPVLFCILMTYSSPPPASTSTSPHARTTCKCSSPNATSHERGLQVIETIRISALLPIHSRPGSYSTPTQPYVNVIVFNAPFQ